MLYTFFIIMPLMLLSGSLTPVRNMPAILLLVTYVHPLRFGIDMVRRVYLEGAVFSDIAFNFVPLLLVTAVTLRLPPGSSAAELPDELDSSMSTPRPPRRHRSPVLHVLLPCTLAAALAGCTVGLDYQRPSAAAPADWTSWRSGDATVRATSASDNRLPAAWWRGFGDSVLDEL